jgi:transcriptional regulator with XRE-family HTH domain
MSFGERIKTLRDIRGWQRKEAAEALNMPYTTYTNYETDQREPKNELIVKFADFYKVSTDYLLCRSNSFNLADALPLNHVDKEFCHELESICLKLNNRGRETLLTTARAFINDEELKKGPEDSEDVRIQTA